ncbi:unnamed protein product [Eretmochelys imbricata]
MQLRRLRADDNPHIASLYAEVKCSADAVSVEESLPPTRGRKMNYDNIDEYDRRNVFIPFLDHVISELQKQVIDCSSRFLAQFLVPDKLHVLENENTVMALNDAYKVDLSNLDNFKAELQRWHEKWIDIPRDEQPNSILSTLQELMPASYPDLNILPSLLGHHANQCCFEKHIRVLQTVKTWLKSSLCESQLTELALMYIHQDTDSDVVQILEDFYSSKH